MLDVVIDTNILVSGLLSPYGNPAQVVNALKSGRIHIYYNTEILAEYRDVLSRSRLGLHPPDVKNLLETIAAAGSVIIPQVSLIVMPDKSDRIFYDTARESGGLLVTGNTKHYPAEPFIVTPAQFVEIIKRGV